MKSFTTDVFSNRIPVFEKHLSFLKNKPNLRFLEVGSSEGHSAVWTFEHILTHESSHLVCIDIFDNLSIEERFLKNIAEYGDRIKVIKDKSENALLSDVVRQHQYDFIYVDGFHASKEVLEDAVLCFSLLKPGCIMILDDYLWGPEKSLNDTPKLAIDSFLNCYRNYLHVLELKYSVVVRKKKINPP